MPGHLDRREFLRATLAVAASAAHPLPVAAAPRRPYRGPNVVLIRFGGGVRRQEILEAEHTFAPFFRHELARRGTLYSGMEIATDPGIDTSHGQGTLNLLLGRYAHYEDVLGRPLGDRFEAQHPTLFEYLRARFTLALHEVLILNHEDRLDEEFYAFSNHPDYGARHRCGILSRYRLRRHGLQRKLADADLDDALRAKLASELSKLDTVDHREPSAHEKSPALDRFWERWTAYYGASGLVEPRGDRFLTELALRAMAELRPRFLLVNYNDPDYVHWGLPDHYRRGIAIIDEGIRRIVEAVDRDPFYRSRTVIAVVPDCGRDDNRAMAIPYQHHFNSASSRRIFGLLTGPGIARGQVIARPTQQIDVTPTLGQLMGVRTEHCQGDVLGEALA